MTDLLYRRVVDAPVARLNAIMRARDMPQFAEITYVRDEQAERDADNWRQVVEAMRDGCWTIGSLRVMAGDLSNAGWDGTAQLLRRIADALDRNGKKVGECPLVD